MADNDRFKIVFDHLELTLNRDPGAETLRRAMIQSREIRRLRDIMDDSIPDDDPVLYSRSSASGRSMPRGEP